MEQNKNSLVAEAEYDSATGTFVARPAQAPASALEPVAFRTRADGWTPARQRRFLEELADCGIVKEAAARVGMSRQSAWQLRRRSVENAPFAAAWEAALSAGARARQEAASCPAGPGAAAEAIAVPGIDAEEAAWIAGAGGMPVAECAAPRAAEAAPQFAGADDGRRLLSLLAALRDPAGQDVAAPSSKDWDRWIGAVANGLSAPRRGPGDPAGDDCLLWRDERGAWWTRFPRPDYAVTEEGARGDKAWRRTLSEEEEAAVVNAFAADRHDGAAAGPADCFEPRA